ncbi:MAG: hypothetical protein [brine shrimp arlivirus 5]|nr:MAG: hypothetical protein [brine shrimp arlivirus 5]
MATNTSQMAASQGQVHPLAQRMINIGKSRSAMSMVTIKSTQTTSLAPALTINRPWTVVNLGASDKEREQNAVGLFGLINTPKADPNLVWSILVHILGVNEGTLSEAVQVEGFKLEKIDYKNLDPKPDAAWVMDTFFKNAQQHKDIGVVAVILSGILGILLGKIITVNNTTYLSVRSKKIAEMAQFDLKTADWYSSGCVTENLIKLTANMSQSPHIRSVIFQKLVIMASNNKSPLLKVWKYTLQMLDGAFMTTQLTILRELAPRSQLLIMIPDMKEEFERFAQWYHFLPEMDKRLLGYLRLLYGDDKTAPVAINKVKLSTVVAVLLDRLKSTSMANYAAPEKLDPKLQARAQTIVDWVVKHESRDPEMRSHMAAMQMTREDIADIFNTLAGKKEDLPTDASLPVSFQ